MGRSYELEFWTMRETDVLFFERLGRRIRDLRKKSGLTQTQLGDLLDLKQDMVASYETGRRRVPASLLPPLARVLGTSVEDLLGEADGKGRPGPTPRLLRQIEQVSRLPRSKQKFVSEFLDTLIQQGG
jgi:transcriptional regulator with XRE-family HTH domain